MSAPAKYGLIKSKPLANKGPISAKPRSAVFACASEDSDDDERPLAKASRQLCSSSSSAVPINEDPSIYDYDGHYDSLPRVLPNNAPRTAQEPASSPFLSPNPPSLRTCSQKAKYIGNLMVTSQIRERERERQLERKLLKERQAEDSNFSEQPKFVTAAYKQKLLEEKKWDYVDKLSDALDEHTDVRALGMQGFYSGFLTKNIAMGGDVGINARSAYTAGSAGQKQFNPLESSTPGAICVADEAEDKVDACAPPQLEQSSPLPLTSGPSDAALGPALVQESAELRVLSARDRYLARKRNAGHLDPS